MSSSISRLCQDSASASSCIHTVVAPTVQQKLTQLQGPQKETCSSPIRVFHGVKWKVGKRVPESCGKKKHCKTMKMNQKLPLPSAQSFLPLHPIPGISWQEPVAPEYHFVWQEMPPTAMLGVPDFFPRLENSGIQAVRSIRDSALEFENENQVWSLSLSCPSCPKQFRGSVCAYLLPRWRSLQRLVHHHDSYGPKVYFDASLSWPSNVQNPRKQLAAIEALANCLDPRALKGCHGNGHELHLQEGRYCLHQRDSPTPNWWYSVIWHWRQRHRSASMLTKHFSYIAPWSMARSPCAEQSRRDWAEHMEMGMATYWSAVRHETLPYRHQFLDRHESELAEVWIAFLDRGWLKCCSWNTLKQKSNSLTRFNPNFMLTKKLRNLRSFRKMTAFRNPGPAHPVFPRLQNRCLERWSTLSIQQPENFRTRSISEYERIIHPLQYTLNYISYHIISYHIISYHIISYHIISYHIISYHIISYHIISYHIISYHIISIRVPYHLRWLILKKILFVLLPEARTTCTFWGPGMLECKIIRSCFAKASA